MINAISWNKAWKQNYPQPPHSSIAKQARMLLYAAPGAAENFLRYFYPKTCWLEVKDCIDMQRLFTPCWRYWFYNKCFHHYKSNYFITHYICHYYSTTLIGYGERSVGDLNLGLCSLQSEVMAAELPYRRRTYVLPFYAF